MDGIKYNTKIFYLVASKCSRNHFISEKKTVKLFKPYFLQNSLIVQLYTFARIYKGVLNTPGSQFVKAFSALPLYS
jgi:hypothetical protein